MASVGFNETTMAGPVKVKLNLFTLSGRKMEMPPVQDSMLGADLVRLVAKLHPSEAGSRYYVQIIHALKYMELDKSLKQHGIDENTALTCLYLKATAQQVLKVITSAIIIRDILLADIPVWDTVHTLRWMVVGVALPSRLQSFTFNGYRSLDQVALPSGLQNLTFGDVFNQNMDQVALPSGLQSLTFGANFNQNIDKVALPSGLQSLTFGTEFDQSMDQVTLPSGLQSLSMGIRFDFCM